MYAPSPILDLVPFRAGVAAFAASTSAAASAASAAPARAAWSSSTWHSQLQPLTGPLVCRTRLHPFACSATSLCIRGCNPVCLRLWRYVWRILRT